MVHKSRLSMLIQTQNSRRTLWESGTVLPRAAACLPQPKVPAWLYEKAELFSPMLQHVYSNLKFPQDSMRKLNCSPLLQHFYSNLKFPQDSMRKLNCSPPAAACLSQPKVPAGLYEKAELFPLCCITNQLVGRRRGLVSHYLWLAIMYKVTLMV